MRLTDKKAWVKTERNGIIMVFDHQVQQGLKLNYCYVFQLLELYFPLLLKLLCDKHLPLTYSLLLQ